jgi:fructose-1,6-bisphosphatase I
MKIPSASRIYSINEGNTDRFPEPYRRYLRYIHREAYSARYIGSLVGDFHRTLIMGGVFLYPPTTSAPHGKLRLLYEANPLAMVAEQAGGAASNGATRILDIVPADLHERVPLIIGSTVAVDTVLKQL